MDISYNSLIISFRGLDSLEVFGVTGLDGLEVYGVAGFGSLEVRDSCL